MDGDERKRFCQQCKLNVYNISEMKADEASELIRSSTGRLCVRLYRRKDGTVITRDCPVAIARIRRLARKSAALVLGLTAWLGFSPSAFGQGSETQGGVSFRAEVGRMPAHPQAEAEDYSTQPREVIQGINTGTACRVPPSNPSFGEYLFMLLFGTIIAAAGLFMKSLKKRSSMWIIGGSMVVLFALLGAAWFFVVGLGV